MITKDLVFTLFNQPLGVILALAIPLGLVVLGVLGILYGSLRDRSQVISLKYPPVRDGQDFTDVLR